MNLVEVTDSNFQNEVLKSDKPVLLDFWSEWCGPCKMIGPIFDELAADYEGRIRFGKVNIDENHGLATQFCIRAVPTLLLFKAGDIEEQFVGLKSKRDLKAALDAALE